MARTNRRPTFWKASVFADDTVPEGAMDTVQLLDPTDLEAEKEPTLIRIVGALHLGSTPESLTVPHVIALWWALHLGDINAGFPNLSTNAGMEDERIIYSGVLQNIWVTAPISTTFDSSGVPTGTGGGAVPLQGNWDFERFDARSMRKVRDGDGLCLSMYLQVVAGNPTRVNRTGYIRALIKER